MTKPTSPRTSCHAEASGNAGEGTPPFNSFWMGGFEGADHVNGQGEALDLVCASGHLRSFDQDYAHLARLGVATVRESIGWRLSEQNKSFDFSRAQRFAEAARRHGVQILWSLMHYGTPDGVSMLDDDFPRRFADFAAAAARALRPLTPRAPVYTPINEIGFLAWAVSATDMFHPYGLCSGAVAQSTVQSGFDVKCRLVRASVLAMDAILSEDPRARFLHIEPLVHVVAPRAAPELAPLAAEVRAYQWQVWDLIAGRLRPELGGQSRYLDLIGVNHYHNGQWEVSTEERLHWHLQDPRRMPFGDLLREAWSRYRRPLIVAETSHIGSGRAQWLHDIASQVVMARDTGVTVDGICLYPIVDRPDWSDATHWHQSGLWDASFPSQSPEALRACHLPKVGEAAPVVPRRLKLDYAKALKRWMTRLPGTQPRTMPP
jgi:beta-glucosidase/6-phospho-beta-glucosidase/beta-galactosidase